ncbi:MAG: UbiA family prenyltransferase [Bdellovibrionota bacterium]
MLPVTHGEGRTRLEILVYTVLLIPVTVLPYFLHASGKIYLVSALALGGFYLWKTVQLLGRETKADAKKLFWISIVYLFLLFIALFADVIIG